MGLYFVGIYRYREFWGYSILGDNGRMEKKMETAITENPENRRLHKQGSSHKDPSHNAEETTHAPPSRCPSPCKTS